MPDYSARRQRILGNKVLRLVAGVLLNWCPHQELNLNQRFRKPSKAFRAFSALRSYQAVYRAKAVLFILLEGMLLN